MTSEKPDELTQGQTATESTATESQVSLDSVPLGDVPPANSFDARWT